MTILPACLHPSRSAAPLLLLAAALVVGGPTAASAQTPPPPASMGEAEREVLGTIQRLFDGMRARDGVVVGSTFHPEARLQTALVDPSGTPSARVGGIEGFVQAVGQPGEPWNESIDQVEIRVDGTMAHAWVPYTFRSGDRFSHCGVNSVQLVRLPEGWKILSLVDTRQTEGCPNG